ncbi:MAG: aminoglycoside phosphotransferase family protein [Pirellulaceae bacterium]|nr:aminoglycoside phosphotransferase family protein [Pirellulaceae bacterium]
MAAFDQMRLIVMEALKPWEEKHHARLENVECTDPQLCGHEFKYDSAGQYLTGVYPYQISYLTEAGSRRTLEVMVKAKPDQVQIISVYQSLLDAGGIDLSVPLKVNLERSDYAVPNLKELGLFRDFSDRLQPYLPKSMGFFVNASNSYTLRIEKKLSQGSVILNPDDDTTNHWKNGFFDLALMGMADLHSRFFEKYQPLVDTRSIFVCDRQSMVQGEPLWRALLHFIAEHFQDEVTEERLGRHREILDHLADWFAEVDQQPKTLLYGDFNPQNLAFEKTENGFELSLFDWERALIGLPQRDLAEHLIYSLPVGFDEEQVLAAVTRYREALSDGSGETIAPEEFNLGLKWMLYDLILNRLPLMMLVKHVANKRPHSNQAYANAHRLVSILE